MMVLEPETVWRSVWRPNGQPKREGYRIEGMGRMAWPTAFILCALLIELVARV